MRSLKYLLLLGLAVVLALNTGAVSAQNNVNGIKYGETVEGEITNDTFEQIYAFEATGADIIFARLTLPTTQATPGTSLPPASSRLMPVIILTDSSNKVLIDTLSSGGATTSLLLTFQLPGPGSYNLIVTRRDGRAGRTAGRFMLELNSPLRLELDKPVEDKITPLQQRLYVVETDKPFSVAIDITNAGRFHPGLSINRLIQGRLNPVADLYGLETAGGLLIIQPTAKTTYIVSVGRSRFDVSGYATTEPAASFAITFSEYKPAR
jgi:hypothetical protein